MRKLIISLTALGTLVFPLMAVAGTFAGRGSLDNGRALTRSFSRVALSPVLPTGNLAGNQRRPDRVIISDISKVVPGDHGDALLAGVTRYKRLAPPTSLRLSNFGRLHWTAWNATFGRARGALWIDSCSPICARGTYQRVKATVHVYRPNRSGVFTRMTIHAGPDNGTVSATRSSGVWYWQ